LLHSSALAQQDISGEKAKASQTKKVTLKEALSIALARNPSIRIAAEEVRRADALVTQARAGSLPTLVGNAVYTRLDDDRTLNGRVISGADQLSANLTLSVPLFAPTPWVQWSQARVQRNVLRADAADTQRQVAGSVANAYLTIVAQRRVVEVNARAQTTADAHYQDAHLRFTSGLGNRLDEARARQEFASTKASTELALANLNKAREALGVLLGSSQSVDAADQGDPRTPPSLAQALSNVSRTRADLRALRQRVVAADRMRDDIWAAYAPNLSGQFQPFYQNPPTLVNPLTGWQAFLILSLPIYDGGRRYGLADEYAATAAQARASFSGALRQARSDVRTAFTSMQRAEAALQASNEAAQNANLVLELATESYRAGAGTNLEVVDAERRARDAGTDVAVAEDAARKARVDFLMASGYLP